MTAAPAKAPGIPPPGLWFMDIERVAGPIVSGRDRAAGGMRKGSSSSAVKSASPRQVLADGQRGLPCAERQRRGRGLSGTETGSYTKIR